MLSCERVAGYTQAWLRGKIQSSALGFIVLNHLSLYVMRLLPLYVFCERESLVVRGQVEGDDNDDDCIRAFHAIS